MIERRDKRGRRIGRNWWREYVTEQWRHADDAWQALRESGQPIHTSAVPGAGYDTAHYQLTDSEFRTLHPRPLFKDFLLGYRGMADCHDPLTV